jgi:hypothetical protein
MTLTYTVETLTDLTKRIEKIRARWDDPKLDDAVGIWFRGVAKSQFSLVPKLYRHVDANKAARAEAEDDIREDFIRRALSLTPHKPANSWEWYFLMQHYGAPTRLLDWTESLQIGLYFAVKDSEGVNDAALWVIDPWWLNDRVLGETEVLPPGSAGLADADAKRYHPWLPERFDAGRRLKKELPVAILSNYFDPRIAAQRSCFTIHGVRTEGLEKLFPRSKDHLAKIIIPAYAVENILDELEENGIDQTTIYPDLQGLGAAVANGFLERVLVDPHKKLYTRLQPSPIDGVGVFAIRKIKKGTRLFSEDLDEMRWVNADDLPKQKVLRSFYDDFAVWKGGRCGVPGHFHRLTMSWYLNDPRKGEKPNVVCDENYQFRSSRNIKRGEELTVDSTTYSDHAKSVSRRASKTGSKK